MLALATCSNISSCFDSLSKALLNLKSYLFTQVSIVNFLVLYTFQEENKFCAQAGQVQDLMRVE